MKAPTTAIADLLQRGRDILVFAELLGIRFNPGQIRWLRYAASTIDGWKWNWQQTIHVAANQIGKTLAVAVLILWACFYKIGVDPSNPEGWQSRPYLWFHLAPTQQQAYHALNDARMLIKGSHPAQGDRCKLSFVENKLVSETKVATYYDGLEFWNGAICQFRTTDDKASALQGYRASGISVDEAAFEDHLRVVVNETLMMRLISTGGPLHMVSTPNGMNDYFDFVEDIRKYNDSPEERVWVDRNGKSAVAWSVITDNVGFGITQVQVDHMEANLDPATKEQQLRGAFLEPAEAFFVPGDKILAAFRRGIPEEEQPLPGHRYAIFWDVSVASDPTVAVVVDITKPEWRGVYFKHYPRPMGITQLLNAMMMLHINYNSAEDPRRMLPRSRATTGYDATAMGGVMFKQMLRNLTPSRPVNFGGPSEKLKMLTSARAVLTKGDLVLPDTWTRMRQEVLSYRLKDDKLRQDCVMALVGAVNVANSGMGIGVSRPMNVSARITPTRR